MNSTEKEIFYNTSNTYSTLNTLTKETKNIWFVCHGMGYLSRYFIKYFKDLPSQEHYIVAPQASSKYYQGEGFKHVGASWLTRENTIAETDNVMRYFDSIFETEILPNNKNLVVFGYSQGVSVSMRYLAKRQVDCHHLILHSGGIPKELTAKDFIHFNGLVTLIYGTQDQYLNEERITHEIKRARELFGDKVNVIPFEGKHIVNVDIINSLK